MTLEMDDTKKMGAKKWSYLFSKWGCEINLFFLRMKLKDEKERIKDEEKQKIKLKIKNYMSIRRSQI